MSSVTATFLIATPLFLGGARQEPEGFRAASLKGALRFWWRALRYPTLFAESGGSRDLALKELRRREIRLFGGPQERGRVLMRVEPRRTALPVLRKDEVLKGVDGRVVGPGARYLGYGLMGAFGADQGKLQRSCLCPGSCVNVTFAFLPDADRKSFLRALKLFGLVGGLGSRARRGWGSLALVDLRDDGTSVWSPPTSAEDYRKRLLDVLGDVSGGEGIPPFTAFGPKARIDLLGESGSGLEALDRMGQAMQRYRSWGHRGRVNNRDSERNFTDDHDWSKDPFGAKFRSFVPRRIAFGLPQNYGKGFGVAPAEPRADRRASPLFLHVHAIGADAYLGVALLLPADFLPGGQDRVEVRKGGRADVRTARVDWTVLDGFLNGPTDPGRRRDLGPYFPDRTPVLPVPR